ncbi:MAG: endonuclease domain-containing protein [Kiloniellales bacterium]|nr:endonuclease domain-containing protein [Kiloniellales bacterium]
MSTSRARELRRNQTRAEAKLWSALRNRQAAGLKFRRQVPLGPYVVDFFCLSASLVVEVDGGQHGAPDGRAQDARRTRWLEAEGYRVIRFWNNEVAENPEGVLTVILEAAGADDPSPSSG